MPVEYPIIRETPELAQHREDYDFVVKALLGRIAVADVFSYAALAAWERGVEDLLGVPIHCEVEPGNPTVRISMAAEPSVLEALAQTLRSHVPAGVEVSWVQDIVPDDDREEVYGMAGRSIGYSMSRRPRHPLTLQEAARRLGRKPPKKPAPKKVVTSRYDLILDDWLGECA